MSNAEHHDQPPRAEGPSDPAGPGRPHALDAFKMEQICALVAAGCNRAQAARPDFQLTGP